MSTTENLPNPISVAVTPASGEDSSLTAAAIEEEKKAMEARLEQLRAEGDTEEYNKLKSTFDAKYNLTVGSPTDASQIKGYVTRITNSWIGNKFIRGAGYVGEVGKGIVVSSFQAMLNLFSKIWKWFYEKSIKVKAGIAITTAMAVAGSWYMVGTVPIQKAIRYIASLWASNEPPPPPPGLGERVTNQIYSYWTSAKSSVATGDKTTKFLHTTYQTVLSYFDSGTSAVYVVAAVVVAVVALICAVKYFRAKSNQINSPIGSREVSYTKTNMVKNRYSTLAKKRPRKV